MYANVLHKPTVGLSLPYSLPRTFTQCHHCCSQQPREEASRVDHFISPQPKDSKTQRAEAKSYGKVAQGAKTRRRLPSSWSTPLSPLHHNCPSRQGLGIALVPEGKPTSAALPPSPLHRSPRLSLRPPAPWLLQILSLFVTFTPFGIKTRARPCTWYKPHLCRVGSSGTIHVAG